MNGYNNPLYYVTCTVCEKVASATKYAFEKVVNFFEATGRARAASRLADLGYYEQAKQLMLDGAKKND